MDLLTQMMHLEPSKRITVKGAMQHPFFKEYNNSQFTVLPQISPTKHRYNRKRS
jgi:serine/threonine protein kinase